MLVDMTADDFIAALPLLRKVPMPGLPAEECLGRCLVGQYQGLTGVDDQGGVIACVIYYITGTVCFVVALYAENALRVVYNEFLDLLRGRGIKTLRSQTTLDPSAYGRLLGMRPIFTVFERDI